MTYQTVSFGMDEDVDVNDDPYKVNFLFGKNEGDQRIVDLFKKAKKEVGTTGKTSFFLRTDQQPLAAGVVKNFSAGLALTSGAKNQTCFLYNNEIFEKYTDGEILFIFGKKFADDILNPKEPDDIKTTKKIDALVATKFNCAKDAIKWLKQADFSHWLPEDREEIEQSNKARIANLQELANKQKQIEK